MRTSVVLRDHLDVVVGPAAVGLLIFDTEIGEVELVVEVGQVALEGPVADFLLRPIGMAVVVAAVS